MNQIKFEKYDPNHVEVGQIRAGDTETVLIVGEEPPTEEYRYNAVVMDGGFIFNILYTQPQSAKEIIRDHPKLVDVKEIKVVTKEGAE